MSQLEQALLMTFRETTQEKEKKTNKRNKHKQTKTWSRTMILSGKLHHE
jgi:hypothetical protein